MMREALGMHHVCTKPTAAECWLSAVISVPYFRRNVLPRTDANLLQYIRIRAQDVSRIGPRNYTLRCYEMYKQRFNSKTIVIRSVTEEFGRRRTR